MKSKNVTQTPRQHMSESWCYLGDAPLRGWNTSPSVLLLGLSLNSEPVAIEDGILSPRLRAPFASLAFDWDRAFVRDRSSLLRQASKLPPRPVCTAQDPSKNFNHISSDVGDAKWAFLNTAVMPRGSTYTSGALHATFQHRKHRSLSLALLYKAGWRLL